jgi:hypothetical protein
MSLRAAAFAAVFLVGCEGCKTSSKAGPSTDAAPSGSASTIGAVVDAGPVKPRDKTLVSVAEGSADVRIEPTFDGHVVVVSGSVPYEAKPNGALEPLVAVSALAPLYPDDDTFVGFLEPSMDLLWVRGDLGAPGSLFLDGYAGKTKTLLLRDGKLLPAPKAWEARHVVRWRGKLLGANFDPPSSMSELAWLDDKSAPAPPPIAKIPVITGLRVDAQGALVVLGFGSYETPRAAIFPADWKVGDPPKLVEGATKRPTCSLVPSFDASVVLHCSDIFLKVSAAGFERVFADAPPNVSAASIGRDGALYVALEKRMAVERCPAPEGPCTPIEVKGDMKAEMKSANETAHYELDVSDVRERKGDSDYGDRSWTTIRIDPAPAIVPPMTASALVARDENDVWLFVRNFRSGMLLHSTDGAARERVSLPSRLDGRLMVKNAAPPQAWTGHCEQVFVRLPSEDAKKSEDIEKALGAKPLAYDSAFHWWVVEGRLHEDKVSGVIIVRRDVEEPLSKMERATEKLVDALTPNPMSKPKVYCTLPVLDRVLYPVAPP